MFFFAVSQSQGYGEHTSKAMAMSDPSACWMSMDSSGPMNCLEPSRWLWKVTPSSLIFRMPASENTWNPPLSVRIGPFQPMN